MIYDSNRLIEHIRYNIPIPDRLIIPIVIVGELEAFALKADWGYQKITHLQKLLDTYPIADIDRDLTRIYAQIDAYSQGKLKSSPLPFGMSARNMGKNDIWIAATALYLDMPLHTNDHDFDHLTSIGLQLIR
jgi:tRNA(fMet)-specific endonuclease VapC